MSHGHRPSRARLAKFATILFAAALLAGGCGQGLQTPLPELASQPEKPIVAEQKKAAIKGMEELTQKASATQADALKEIERTR